MTQFLFYGFGAIKTIIFDEFFLAQGFTYIAPSVMEEMTKPWLTAREPRSPRKIGLPPSFMRLIGPY